ncbi:MAG: cytochrome c biogenesis protein CcsA [Coriobacteriales bacterium]|jgi:cytochrome c-type biogenesis protein CcmF|nr:cytochrome c biogenesis protein CcsA [Coriobacteriales bacterium]
MAITGIVSLGLAFVAIVISLGAFLVERLVAGSMEGVDKATGARYTRLARRVGLVAYLATLTTTLALTLGCAVLVFCFLTGDISLEYVVQQHSDATGPGALLYRLSGLWGGREGSLLFWAWLIGVFGAVVALRNIKRREALDSMALLVIQLVTLAFVIVLLFSEGNMPFMPLDPHYLDAQGNLRTFEQLLQDSTVLADGTPLKPSLVLGMNLLLEHWAMAIHPPTLFVGYAGATVPFAYALAALVVNDPSKAWVERSRRYALFSWVLLGIGIGLGAVWAYVVLGWGGYWGWDPVENASLLSWLLAAALVHSFTVYRQRGAFKRWSVMCACLTFAFVIVGTFITRSGVVQNSVHAFEGDQVSLVLFCALIVLSVLAGVVGLLIRRRSFGAQGGGDELGDSLFTKDVAYYFNNVVLTLSAFVLAYLTLSSALPSWMPYGGLSLSASTYNAIARPLGILYCLLMAVGPLFSWAKADRQAFVRKARVPACAALVVFAALVVYFLTTLMPAYQARAAAGGAAAATLLESGPAWYYFALTLLGFLVASLLLMNSLFMVGRVVGGVARSRGANVVVAFFAALRRNASTVGGFLAHASMAVILVGLIGSSMYVTESSGYLPFDEENDTATGEFVVRDYRLVYVTNDISSQRSGEATYHVTFDVYQGETYRGKVSPGIELVEATQQRKPLAAVLSAPLEDLFVVYNGVNDEGDLSLSAFVNPCISFVWAGFALLMLGTAIAALGRFRPRTKDGPEAVAPASAAGPAPDVGAQDAEGPAS